MKMYVGITDFDWFNTLKQANCDEVKDIESTNVACLLEPKVIEGELETEENSNKPNIFETATKAINVIQEYIELFKMTTD